VSSGGVWYRLAGMAAHLLLSGVMRTARFRTAGEEHYLPREREGEPSIFVLWHGRLLPLAYLHRWRGIVGLISQSRDGEYITQLLVRLGFGAVRGSSSRGGGPALRALVREARAGRSLALTPDGPRGPRQKMKLGPLVIAQLSGVPIVPVAASADRGWWRGTWDRFLVPRPFARVRVLYGPPREIPRDATQPELERMAAALEAELNRMTDEVDGRAAAR
jgi:lysophospholipid acyltransferase (LPLAT)-like uncharacterized protein